MTRYRRSLHLYSSIFKKRVTKVFVLLVIRLLLFALNFPICIIGKRNVKFHFDISVYSVYILHQGNEIEEKIRYSRNINIIYSLK